MRVKMEIDCLTHACPLILLEFIIYRPTMVTAHRSTYLKKKILYLEQPEPYTYLISSVQQQR